MMKSSDEEFRQNVLNFIHHEIAYDEKFRRTAYPLRAMSYLRLIERFAVTVSSHERLDKLLVTFVRSGELMLERHPHRADIADADVVAHYRIPTLLEKLAFAAR